MRGRRGAINERYAPKGFIEERLDDLRYAFTVDRDGRRYLAWMGAFLAFAYFARVQLDDFIGTGRDPGYTVWTALALIGVPVTAAIAVPVVIRLWRYAEREGHYLPFIVLIAGGALVFLAPEPPATEEARLGENRAEYERLVGLVRDGRLVHSARCPAPAFAPPVGDEALAADCIFLAQREPLVVEFAPRNAYRPLVYFEDPAAPWASSACGTNGDVLRAIDANWYVCRRKSLPDRAALP